ncbi:MAG: hypothetical protein EXR47_04410 [Dehalococcoidia bacterium]|nr:hypothetical protein [Dehalococcoidia bacterium]
MTNAAKTRARLLEVYRRLYDTYGPQHWWPGETPFEVCIGAILTQAASWSNVEKGLANLKDAGVFSVKALRETPQHELAQLLYPCGYYNAKARKLKAFVDHLGERYSDDLGAFLARPAEALRDELLGVHGIGEETADDIVLYAAGQPSFVVDAYTRRLLARLGLADSTWPYERRRALFMDALPRDAALFNEYHALIVRHGKERCRKREPLCEGCPLLGVCAEGSVRLRKTPSNEAGEDKGD